MYLASCLVSGPSLGPSLCSECDGFGPRGAKQVPRALCFLSYCEYCLYFDLCLCILWTHVLGADTGEFPPL